MTSRSGDSTARIWTVADGTCRSNMQNGLENVVVLKHFKGRTNEKSKDVTTLDWNVSVYHILCLRFYVPRILNENISFSFKLDVSLEI